MPEKLSKELLQMKDDELVAFIRDTVARLHVVADYLETYVTEEIPQPDVPFDTDVQLNGGHHEEPPSP